MKCLYKCLPNTTDELVQLPYLKEKPISGLTKQTFPCDLHPQKIMNKDTVLLLP